MQNTYDAAKIKEAILSFIRLHGPSLPVHIARRVNQSPLFTSAFLSELYREGKLRMSSLRIGSSSLYLIEGQEEQLEKFTEHLNQREKEALTILKKNKILVDSELTPVIRVALNEIKDFAIPFKSSEDPEKKLWKFAFQEPEKKEETPSPVIQEAPTPEPPKETHSPAIQEVSTPEQAKIQEAPKQNIEPIFEQEKQGPIEPTPEIKKPEKLKIPKPEPTKIQLSAPFSEEIKEEPIKKVIESQFLTAITDHLKKRKITVVETILEKKKELTAKVSLDTHFGEQHFLLVAKDKKRLKEEELIEAIKQAHAEKMPALLIAPGTLEKKALSTYAEWQNLIKFEKLP